jgi:hypothetical protein
MHALFSAMGGWPFEGQINDIGGPIRVWMAPATIFPGTEQGAWVDTCITMGCVQINSETNQHQDVLSVRSGMKHKGEFQIS